MSISLAKSDLCATVEHISGRKDWNEFQDNSFCKHLQHIPGRVLRPKDAKTTLAIAVRWNGKGKAHIETRVSDPWDIDDFLSARMTWHKLIHSVDYRVPILLDFRESSSAPQGIMRHFIAIHRTPHPRQGHIHVLGRNAALERLGMRIVEGVVDPSRSVIYIDSDDDIVY